MEAESNTFEYEQEKGMEKDHINYWYRLAGCILAFELSCMMCEEADKNKSTISTELVIGGYYGKEAFRARININEVIVENVWVPNIYCTCTTCIYQNSYNICAVCTHVYMYMFCVRQYAWKEHARNGMKATGILQLMDANKGNGETVLDL